MIIKKAILASGIMYFACLPSMHASPIFLSQDASGNIIKISYKDWEKVSHKKRGLNLKKDLHKHIQKDVQFFLQNLLGPLKFFVEKKERRIRYWRAA